MWSRSRAKLTVGPLTDKDGTLVSNDKDIGSLLNELFASIFTHIDTEFVVHFALC